jgi:hypothetical protein
LWLASVTPETFTSLDAIVELLSGELITISLLATTVSLSTTSISPSQ